MRLFLIMTLSVLSLFTQELNASSSGIKVKNVEWSFDGVFGKFDKESARRGFEIYKQVCSSCHSMNKLHYRNLEGLGFSKSQIKEIAASYNVQDGPNDAGDMFERPATASDRFVSPFANENAARASNNGALPPDLTLMVKAKPNGANYIFSLLTGYETPPEGFKMNDGMYYNKYFEGHQIAMSPPLSEGIITYEDGKTPSVEQAAKDVVNFLQFTAEPEMEKRKNMGVKTILFLVVMTGFFVVAKKRIWSSLK